MIKPIKTIFFLLGVLCCSLVVLSGRALAEQATPQQGSKRLPRAYEGAPPLIPHDAEARKGMCLACHEFGIVGAPITPHPTRNDFCIQCHVGQDLAVQVFPAVSAQEEKSPR
ncbi:periplasmic nitrate reductase, small subunit (napB); diheme cytochrome C [Candidatus Methylomirabilis lanthanidiphila]|uniref:Periplasmic nitrate reductase, small subunit (NapB) diheme cytochrome C n=1 Tax=Candidatus Methylomirabilis lanthanidiphila TaxID=2211376 RepID=A0A564ZGG5_9BACT|nr:nitrate reductase cytochrome c-type subunit [Candidatus Methylomirabilis lanthanidiphila]VUZ84216.1 periplasmic nitrate reductase, small subunit (napB); diheme cytochrome C [Candidatus Methylomirabilis lanthanidiphila]